MSRRKFLPHHRSDDFWTFSKFQVLFQRFIGRPCYFVNAEVTQWWYLFTPESYLYPSHFGNYFGKSASHDAYMRANFKRVLKEKRPLMGRFGNYIDLLVPFLDQGRCLGYLISGPVLEKPLTVEELRLQWKAWTGVEGSDLDRDFLHFTQVALRAPILDAKGLDAYVRLMELLVLWVTEDRVPGIGRELDRLRIDVFSRQLPHPYWVDWAVGRDKFFAMPEKGYTVPPWVREEVGVSRVPTVVAALMPRKPSFRASSLELLCQARRFQNECYRAAREAGEIACASLGDYGTLVLTSARPNLTPSQSRQEVRERIQAFCRTLETKLRMDIVAGIGPHIPQGSGLARSYHGALTALHSAVQAGKKVLSNDAPPSPPPGMSLGKMQDLIRDMNLSLAHSSATRLAQSRENFIQHLLYTGYGPEITKAYMVSVLYILLERFGSRTTIGQSTARNLGSELMDRLDAAMTLPELMVAFKESIDRLAYYQDKPRDASVKARLNILLEDINKEPHKPWRLAKLSQKLALSAPTFLKWFKRVTGRSFGSYVRHARLAKAEKLLKEENLTLERIAQECGFASASSFSILFHKAHGTSPRKYVKRDR